MQYEKMSRRKQANPKSIKIEEGVDDSGGTAAAERPAMLVEENSEFDGQEGDDYDEFAPLVIDTASVTDDYNDQSDLDTKMLPVGDSAPQAAPSGGESVDCPAVKFAMADGAKCAADKIGQPKVVWPAEGATGETKASGGVKEGVRLTSPSKTRRKSDKIQPLSCDAGQDQYMCPVCSEVLGGSHQLTRHIRSHNTATTTVSANTCTICGKALSSQSSLDRHMLVHSGERPFHCRVCNMAFTTNGNMHRHMRIHAKEATQGSTPGADGDGPKTSPEATDAARPRAKRRSAAVRDGGRNSGRDGRRDGGLLAKRLENGYRSAFVPIAAAAAKATAVSTIAVAAVKKEPSDSYRVTGGTGGTGGTVTINGAAQAFSKPLLMVDVKQEAPPVAPVEVKRSSAGVVGGRSLLPLPPKGSESGVLAEDASLRCWLCDQAFLCDYSLDEHLKLVHAQRMLTCGVCGQPFRSARLLQQHAACHRAVLPPVAAPVLSDPPHTSLQGLSFTEFSSANFPLVSRAWCERKQAWQGGTASGHQVACARCGRVFPHAAARDMHARACGTGDDMCVSCEMSFASGADRRTHALVHHAQEVRSKFSRLRCTDDNDIQDVVDQTDFMLVLGLRHHGDGQSEPARPKAAACRNVTLANALTSSGGSLLIDMDSESDGQREENGTAGSGGDGEFTCKFCDETFHNLRALKSHARCHLGPTPYRCPLCSYLSADRSTLERHERTHNGERPYQCRACTFAFTTKANCERHVRKKHGCKTKEQLEMVIGYNRPTADEPTADEPTADEPAATSLVATETEPAEPAAAAAAAGASSPEGDTVCKYCGRDFEFARALKHHVRSHSSCRSKPYVCVPCGHGFSTRANCTRHVHRQHAHLPPNNLHRHIRLNATRTPPPAPYTGTYITSPPTVKCDVAAAADDDDDSDDDEPLDFSMKGGVSQAAAATAVRGRDQWESSSDEDEDDEPMDLSLHGQRASESVGVAVGQVGGQVVGQVGGQAAGQVSRQVAGQVGGQTGRQAAGQVGGQAARQAVGQVARPVAIKAAGQAAGQAGREAAGQAGRQAAGPATNLLLHMRAHSTEHQLRCPCCQIDFTVKDNLERHLRTKHAQNLIEPTGALLCDAGVPSLGSGGMGGAGGGVGGGGSLSSDSELSSVTRILDVTDAARLPAAAAAFFCSSDDEPSSAASSPHGGDAMTDGGHKRPHAAAEATGRPKEGHADDEPTKRKRNSYADSPHKLQCPYCPRAFPWVSSLKRHILTHTGQKPFKCPQCPVTFSTKSNRERHMVRKHGLDIHDAATRQLMDRPYKCHICVFSSFAVASSLLKHYQEKHPEADIPEDVVVATAASSPLVGTSGATTLAALEADFNDSASSVSEMSDEQNSFLDAEDSDDHGPMEEGLRGKLLESTLGVKVEQTTPEKVARECWRSGERAESRKGPLPHVKEEQHLGGGRGGGSGGGVGGGGPFKCYLCDAAFVSRLNCLQHKVEAHASEWAQLSERNSIKDGLEKFVGAMNQMAEDSVARPPPGSAGVVGSEGAAEVDSGVTESDYVQRKIYCSLCVKRFWSLQDLRRHMRSHTGERPFECKLCQKRFTLKHSMMRHQRRHMVAGCVSGSEDENSVMANEDGPSLPSGGNTKKLDVDLHGHHEDNSRTPDTKKDISSSTNGSSEKVMKQDEDSCTDGADSPSSGSHKQLLHRRIRALQLKQRLKSVASRNAAGSSNGMNSDLATNSNLLPNLLGVEDATIDKILDSFDNVNSLLGV